MQYAHIVDAWASSILHCILHCMHGLYVRTALHTLVYVSPYYWPTHLLLLALANPPVYEHTYTVLYVSSYYWHTHLSTTARSCQSAEATSVCNADAYTVLYVSSYYWHTHLSTTARSCQSASVWGHIYSTIYVQYYYYVWHTTICVCMCARSRKISNKYEDKYIAVWGHIT
jgi:hypothetical protein